ncbi:MAG: Gfo/Idh/MocA family oxidoreductase [Candidatus Latescibacterota bacterium]|nr:Gfo/Idh/MocA family oxidoreductase [Candidatus Latescibacterota bacterium]
MSRVKVGMVGLGQRGLQHLNALWELANAEIVALCDPATENLTEEKIKKFVPDYQQKSVRLYTCFDNFLNEGGLDAIYFCIPPSLHQGELIGAADAGIHLFIEKPVSLFLDEALEMQSAIERNAIIATVGFNQRHDNWYIGIRDFVKDKRLVMMTFIVNGTLESHSVKHTKTESIGGPQNRVWAANRSWSGGTIVEAGIHQTDLMRFWAGDIEWVEAHYIHRDDMDIEDSGDNPYAYSVTYGFTCGMIAHLSMSRLRKTFWGDSYDDIIWDRGHLKLEDGGPVAYCYNGPYPPSGPIETETLRHPLNIGQRNNNTLEINRAFIQAVNKNSEHTLFNTFSSSINSHAAVLGANVSDELGGKRVVLSDLLYNDSYSRFRKKV